MSCPIDNLTNASDLSQDFVCGSGPDERTSGAVVVADEGFDAVDQLLGACERTAASFTLSEEPEPALNLIEPGHIGRREVKVEAGTACQPASGLGMLVGAVIVHHEMRTEARRDIGLDALEEPKELLMPMARLALGQDLAIGDIECGKQRGGAVPFVVMSEAIGIAKAHGQDRLGSLQRLGPGSFRRHKEPRHDRVD